MCLMAPRVRVRHCADTRSIIYVFFHFSFFRLVPDVHRTCRRPLAITAPFRRVFLARHITRRAVVPLCAGDRFLLRRFRAQCNLTLRVPNQPSSSYIRVHGLIVHSSLTVLKLWSATLVSGVRGGDGSIGGSGLDA